MIIQGDIEYISHKKQQLSTTNGLPGFKEYFK